MLRRPRPNSGCWAPGLGCWLLQSDVAKASLAPSSPEQPRRGLILIVPIEKPQLWRAGQLNEASTVGLPLVQVATPELSPQGTCPEGGIDRRISDWHFWAPESRVCFEVHCYLITFQGLDTSETSWCMAFSSRDLSTSLARPTVNVAFITLFQAHLKQLPTV